MKKSYRPVLQSGDIPYCAVWITLIYFYFINLLESAIESGLLGRIYVISVFLIIALYVSLHKYVPRVKIDLNWLLFLIVVLTSSKLAIANGNLYWVSIFLTLIVLLFLLSGNARWAPKMWKKVTTIGGIHIGATMLFFALSPTLYQLTLFHVWNGAPGGCTISDAYKAGLCNHYSTNGVYCSIVFLLLGTKLVLRQKQKNKGVEIAALLLSLIAVLLTTKRGPLIFSILALLVTYYVCNPKDGIRKGFYVIAAVLAVLILFFALAPILPLFGDIFNRFAEAEDISSNRFLFWEQAFGLFLDNKTWGIGWGQYVKVNAYGTSVHNIYIQLLCETGIVGLVVFLLAMIKTYGTAIRDYRKQAQCLPSEYKHALACAIAVQTFVIAYGFTGNCLYDSTVFIYFLACASSLSIHHMLPMLKGNITETE